MKLLVTAMGAVFVLALVFFFAPYVGLVLLGLAGLGIPAIWLIGRKRGVRMAGADPGASGTGERGYRGTITLGEEGAAEDYLARRRGERRAG